MTRKPRCVGLVRFEKEAELAEEEPGRKWRSRAVVGGVVLLLALAAGGVWLWKQESAAVRAREERKANLAAAQSQVIAARAAAEEPQIGPDETIARLEKLVQAERRLAALRTDAFAAHLDAVRRTEQRLDTLRAEVMQRRSDEREQAARQRFAAGDAEGGTALLREALSLQRDVDGGPQERARNFDRELRLQKELAELTAEPMQRAVAEKTAQAHAAVAAARYDEALDLFRAARDLQLRLNQEFPRTRFSDLPAIARVDAEIASLTADGIDAQVSKLLGEARGHVSAGRNEEAVKDLVAAAAAQRQLNERFGKSRFVSMERLEEIETERQSILALEPMRAAQAKQEEARRFLRRRQIFQAQRCVREALESMETIATRFPKARGLDETLRAQLAFLNLRSGDLTALQDRIYDQLAPLGEGAKSLLKTEVLQADFAKLMNANPSRNPGRALPVDSLTFAEAEEFCRRLGWLLGWRVRLPSEAEMRAAAASGGDFQNVTGRLDAWLATEGGREVPTAGVWLRDGTVGTAPRQERARTRGFRVVVEVELARLGEVD
jgi:hypothetical protein